MQPVTVGPILGAQTRKEDAVSQRIFVRGSDHPQGRTACVRVAQQGGGYDETRCATLTAGDDFTHVFTFTDLPIGATFDLYACTLGSTEHDDPAWPAPQHSFATSADVPASTSFSFGSCRSPDRGADQLGDDRCFKVIADKFLDDDLMLMCGDQIYADFTLKGWPLFNKKKRMTLEHYFSHYRKFFARPSFAKVTGSMPTYMIWDDHEVLNNWSKGAFDRKEKKFDNPDILQRGEKAYQLYQAALTGAGGKDPQSYHYQFSHGQCDFFVMDQRMQRDVKKVEKGRKEYQLILQNQMDDLLCFIEGGSERVKLIVSPVPLAPDATRRWPLLDRHPEERWEGYPTQRGQLLEAIRAEQAKGKKKTFVILSGDVHCGSLYQLDHRSDPNFRLYQITSSAFNWSVFPGLNDRHFAHKKPLRGNRDYRPKRLGGRVLNQHNFCRVQISDDINVSFYDNRGNMIRNKRLPLA